ncbi:MAG: hypothetical protein AAGC63_07325 [Propionicimonas sp.]|nr:hypothetical protein [Propionicimonas sp.]
MRHSPFPGGLSWLMHFGTMLLLALGIALLVIWLVKRRKHNHHPGAHHPGWQPGSPPFPPQPPQPPSSALQILDERLARGDIDVDDYLTRRAALLGNRPNGTEFNPGAQPSEPQRAEPTEPTKEGDEPA